MSVIGWVILERFMSPLMNNILIIAAVVAAVGYFIWHGLRKRKNGSGCGGGCGCASEKKPGSPL